MQTHLGFRLQLMDFQDNLAVLLHPWDLLLVLHHFPDNIISAGHKVLASMPTHPGMWTPQHHIHRRHLTFILLWLKVSQEIESSF